MAIQLTKTNKSRKKAQIRLLIKLTPQLSEGSTGTNELTHQM